MDVRALILICTFRLDCRNQTEMHTVAANSTAQPHRMRGGALCSNVLKDEISESCMERYLSRKLGVL
jgi:hypothetical protein